MKKILLILAILLLSFSLVNAQKDQIDEYSSLLEQNLDQIDLTETPGIFKFLLGKPKIDFHLNLKDETLIYGFQIKENKIQEFRRGTIENPDYIISADEETINKILESKNPMKDVQKLYLQKKIKIEPQKFTSKAKFKIAQLFF